MIVTKNNTSQKIVLIKINAFLFLLLLSLTAFSCYRSVNHQREKAIEMRNNALEFYVNLSLTTSALTDTERTQRIISLLDESIALDSTYSWSYALKAQILKDEKRYMEAIDLVDKALQYRFEDDDYTISGRYLMKGVLYEKMDSLELSKSNYLSAIHIIDSRIQKDSLDFIALLNRASLEVFIEDENSALEKLEKLRNKKRSEEEYRQIDFLIDGIKKGRSEIVETISIY